MKKPIGFYEITPSQFGDARRKAGFTRDECAALLRVTVRTVRNWENGIGRISYAGFRLLRLISGQDVQAPGWTGWSIREGVLISPNGHTYEAWQLEYVQWVFAAARLWLAERERIAAGVEADRQSVVRVVNVATLYNRRAVREAFAKPRKQKHERSTSTPA